VNDLPLRSKTRFSRPVLLPLGAMILAGCAQPTRLGGSGQDGAAPRATFSRVLVVGVSPDINQRCAFEYALASKISTGQTTAISSCRAMTQKEPLTREGIEAAVASQKADAVVATSLAEKQWDAASSGRDTRGSGSYKATDAGYATGYYGAYGVPVVYGDFQTTASAKTLRGDIEVTSKVWETSGPTEVHTMTTTVKNIESTDQGIINLATAIADRLRREGLTR
jgi:hypothetical protein